MVRYEYGKSLKSFLSLKQNNFSHENNDNLLYDYLIMIIYKFYTLQYVMI